MSSNLDNFIPVNMELASKIGLVDAAIAGAIWFKWNIRKKVCNAGTRELGRMVGLNFSTVSNSIKRLIEAELVQDLTPDRKGAPHDLIPSVDLINTLCKASVEEINSQDESVEEINTSVDLINKEEVKKESTIAENSHEFSHTQLDAATVAANPDKFSVTNIKQMKFTTAQYKQILNFELKSEKPRTSLINYIKKKLTPKPPAVEAYREIAFTWPDKALWADIGQAIGESVEDIELWKKIVKAYIGLGWNKTNIANMIDYFKRGEVPSMNGKGKQIIQSKTVTQGNNGGMYIG